VGGEPTDFPFSFPGKKQREARPPGRADFTLWLHAIAVWPYEGWRHRSHWAPLFARKRKGEQGSNMKLYSSD